MAVLTVSNLDKSFGARELFRDVGFVVNEGERAAFIGANGSGKTTLLRIVAGEEPADGGSVNVAQGVRVGYLKQDADLPMDAPLFAAVVGISDNLLACALKLDEIEREIANAGDSVSHELGEKLADISHRFDGLGGYRIQIEAKAALMGLGFPESDFSKPVADLSGGQKTRAALARLLLQEPDLLLLDEPTNHLDISACEWLQEHIRNRYKGSALIVSHDRYFLDRVVSKVVELDARTVISYPGNYSDYHRLRAERIEEQRRLYKAQQKEIARIEQAIQTLFSDRKFSRRDNKVKQLERIQRIDNVRDRQGIQVGLKPTTRSGRDVLTLRSLSKGFNGKTLFSGISYVLERGRKIGIVGPNGSGKTTLLKIIAGREPQDDGEVVFGANVRPVYFAQEFDHLVAERSVLEELTADADITAKEARDMLARFLFMQDDAFKPVGVLSGGEKCRLALAKVLASGPNLLLMDEPTNHLDIDSRESLEEAIQAFDGTALIASHDRYLLDAVVDTIIEIKDGAFTQYLGNYSGYHDKVSPEPVTPPPTRGKPVVEPPKARPESDLKRNQRLHRELSRKCRELEESIHEHESRVQELTEALGDEASYRENLAGQLSKEYDETSENLERLYAEWESACDALSEVEEALEVVKK